MILRPQSKAKFDPEDALPAEPGCHETRLRYCADRKGGGGEANEHNRLMGQLYRLRACGADESLMQGRFVRFVIVRSV